MFSVLYMRSVFRNDWMASVPLTSHGTTGLVLGALDNPDGERSLNSELGAETHHLLTVQAEMPIQKAEP